MCNVSTIDLKKGEYIIADGDIHVNDPAARTAETGVATYYREDMEKVWLANGGVGYVLLPPALAATAGE